jgi:hypothetical protein
MSKQFKIFLVAAVVIAGVAVLAPYFGVEVSPMPVFEGR